MSSAITKWRVVLTHLFCFFALLFAANAQAQLAQNGTTTSSVTFSNAALTTTISHTTPTLANRLMLVAVHMNISNSTNTTVASVTYNGTALVRAEAETDGTNVVRTELWALVAPPTGAHSVVITVQNVTGGQTVQSVVGITTFVDVDQALAGSVGYTTTSNSNAPSNTLGGLTAGDMVVDYTSVRENAAGNITAAVGAGQTQLYNALSLTPTNDDDVRAISSRETATGANVTMSYNLSATARNTNLGLSLRGATTDVEIQGYATPDLLDGTPTNVTYVFTITAPSAGANNINFSDTLPAGLTIVSATPSQGTCTAAATTTCSLGALINAGDSATVTLVAKTANSTVGTTYNDTATISIGTTDTIAGNNSATVTVKTQSHLCANPGKDGAGGTITGSVNTYFPGAASAAANATSVTVGAGTGTSAIAIGDLLLIIQMQDSTIDANNDDRYGDGAGTGDLGTPGSGSSNLNSAGRYEYIVSRSAITVAGGGTINITGAGTGAGLIYAYNNAAATTTMGQRRFQVIRVPQYTTATLAAGTTAPAWNGSIGGVLAIDAAGTITMGSSAGTGTVATTAGSPTIAGTGTSFTTQIHSGDLINITGEGVRRVLFVSSNTSLALTTNATTTGTGRTFIVPTISLSGIGFRGGAGRGLGGGAGNNTDYRTTAAAALNASKGEGIAGTPRYLFDNSATVLDTTIDGYPNGSSGRGAPGNAGGGGTDGNPGSNDQNSGGAGGGNGGQGGQGGNAWSSAAADGGFGGTFEAPSTTRIVMGGGAGAGTTNNTTASGPINFANGVNSSGVAGGGIVILRANQISGTATIAVNGAEALDVLNDAAGGGGAGGTVIVDTVFGTLTGLTVTARGGDGGNAWLVQTNSGNYPGERHGPGGGGGGGAIYLASAAASTDVTGGANGLTTLDLDNFGAGPGQPGILASPLSVVAGADATFSCAVADLAVTNVGSPDPVTPGSNVTFTQTLTNNGPNAADQVVFTTAIPASTTYQSMVVPAGWTCTTPAVGAGGIITCTFPSLASGGSANFSVVVQAHPGTPAGYIISDTANATSLTNDSNYANNTATDTVGVTIPADADMAVVISTPSTVVPNTNYNVTQTVTNNGGAAAANATFSETTPPNTTFQGLTPPAGWTCTTPAIGGTGAINCTRSTTFASGATASFPLILKVNTGVTAGTSIAVTATTGSTTTDPNTANNTSTSSSIVVAAGSADLATTITALSSPVGPGDLLRYSETVKNNGVVASGATFTQPIPANSSFVSMATPAGWTCTLPAVGATSGTLSCTSTGTLAVGSSTTFLPVFQVNTGTASGTTIPQTVTVATTGGIVDSITANNTATANAVVQNTGTADLAITKTDSPDPVGQGQLVTYLLTVVNNGPEVATGVVVSDVLPASMALVSTSPSQGSCSGTTTITCSLGSISLNGTATISVVVQATTTGTISNTATVTGTLTDPVAGNNTSTTTTTVLAVTLVRLRDFTPTQNKDKVIIKWASSFESDNLGFNLYRDSNGQRVKINRDLIAGTALASKQQSAISDHTYRYRDTLANPSVFTQYWLEDVDIHGVHTMHGPVATVTGSDVGGGGTTTVDLNSVSLPGLGVNGAVVDSPAGFGAASFTPLPIPNGKQTKQQYDLAAAPGLKIYAATEGWYRITRSAMTAAGFDPGTNGAMFQLFMEGTEQPIIVNDGGDGHFDAADSIEFYATPIDTVSTGARTYWLRSGAATGIRVPVTSVNGGDPLTTSIPFTYQRAERGVFFAELTNNGDATNFFGPLVSSEVATQDLPIANLDTTYGGNASLELTVQGGTDQTAHVVTASLNGHPIGQASLLNQAQLVFTFTFPHSWLIAGTNKLSLQALGGENDVSVIALTKLHFQHLLRADNGALQASVPGGRVVTVGGFSANGVRAIDVTDPQNPTELHTTVATDPLGGYAATFTPAVLGQRTVLVFDPSRIITTPELTANVPSSWNTLKKGSNLLIITNNAFTTAATTLKPVRDAQGITTAVVDVEDIYDEFNFGIRSPEAIRSFLQYADGKFKPAPTYVLLVGDASIDPRNYLGLGTVDYMPTKLIATTQLKTASDDWFTDFNGDDIADTSIGRIPVRTSDEASLIFGKITSRGTPTGSWANNVLLFADRPTDYDFAAVATSLTQLLPPSISSSTVNFAQSASPSSDVTNALNGGGLIADYVGHASVEIWSDQVFQSSTAANLSNGNKLPFVVAMDCLNGYFHDLYTDSLAEALLKAPNGGAVAVWASSTLTQPDQQAIMNRELFRILFSTQHMSIGEAARRAKAVTIDQDVRRSWILFGDPSMTLK